MKRYTVSEFCKMVGLPYSTLRYFERIGLLEPEKDDKNNYRQYAVEDAFRINRFKFIRSLGFEAKEAIQIIKADDLNKLKQQVAFNKANLEEELKMLSLRVDAISHYLSHLDFIEDLSHYEIVALNKMLFLSASQGHDFSGGDYQTVSKWVNLLPVATYGKQMSAEDFINENALGINYGMCIEAKNSQYLQCDDFDNQTIVFEAGMYLKCIVDCSIYPEVDGIFFQSIKTLLKNLSKTINGDIYIEGTGYNKKGRNIQIVYVPIQ